jgi:hypothetical protein
MKFGPTESMNSSIRPTGMVGDGNTEGTPMRKFAGQFRALTELHA